MNSNAIIQSDHAQEAAHELRYGDPEAPAVVLLAFHSDRLLEGACAPLLSQVRSLAKHHGLEIRCEAMGGHALRVRSDLKRENRF